jgi:hypothetical protein
VNKLKEEDSGSLYQVKVAMLAQFIYPLKVAY